MNEKELAEIEARAEAATPGPWKPQQGTKYLAMGDMGEEREYFVMRDGDDISICCDCSTPDGEASPENANFIAHARQDVPALCEEVRRLKAWDLKLSQTNIELSQENKMLRAALEKIMRKLGVPQPGNRELVADVYCIANEALKGGVG